MKYYSELVKKNFDSEQECLDAEKKYEEDHTKELALKEERAERAKEVQEAYKHYLELRAKFIEDYKSWHMTLTEKDLPALNTINWFDLFDKFWF